MRWRWNATSREVCPGRGLIVGNHLSYLDVLVIAAEAPVCFVSKTEVRSWPIIGPLLRKAGTILVDRENLLKTTAAREQIAATLAAGVPVVLFPEGTSSDGTEVLPFRAMLLQPALEAGEAITPLAIAYDVIGGDPKTDVAYWGDATFFPISSDLLDWSGSSRGFWLPPLLPCRRIARSSPASCTSLW